MNKVCYVIVGLYGAVIICFLCSLGILYVFFLDVTHRNIGVYIYWKFNQTLSTACGLYSVILAIDSVYFVHTTDRRRHERWKRRTVPTLVVGAGVVVLTSLELAVSSIDDIGPLVGVRPALMFVLILSDLTVFLISPKAIQQMEQKDLDNNTLEQEKVQYKA